MTIRNSCKRSLITLTPATSGAHSEWRGPRERPPLYTKHGWDTPVVGQAYRALTWNLEDGVVRAWWRPTEQEPYGEVVKPATWRVLRGMALRGAAAPRPGPYWSPGDPTRPFFLPPIPLDDEIGPIPERDAFIHLVVHEAFLLNVVVSRHDLLKARHAPRTPPPTHDELVVAYQEVKASGAENREQQDKRIKDIYGEVPKKAREAARRCAGVAGRPGPKPRKL
jgi:hypothetical protein